MEPSDLSLHCLLKTSLSVRVSGINSELVCQWLCVCVCVFLTSGMRIFHLCYVYYLSFFIDMLISIILFTMVYQML